MASYKGIDKPQAVIVHHGTKGQKWHRRLYQNKDGSLTMLGKIRYGSGTSPKKGAKKATPSKPKESRDHKNSNKDVSSMSNKQLQDAINRKKLEQQYKDLETSSAEPKSASRQFAEKIGKKALDAASDVAINAGKAYLQKAIEKKLGIEIDMNGKGLDTNREKTRAEKIKAEAEKMKAETDRAKFDRSVKEASEAADKKAKEDQKQRRDEAMKKAADIASKFGKAAATGAKATAKGATAAGKAADKARKAAYKAGRGALDREMERRKYSGPRRNRSGSTSLIIRK